MNQPLSQPLPANRPKEDQLIRSISPWIAPLGFRIIHLEVQTHRQKILRIFIDRLDVADERSIGIEDCVRVSRALDEKLDSLGEVEGLISGAYELEVSSPGVDRPLRSEEDFQRFRGKEVRIHVYRPLTAEELGNESYQLKNPKQKNFFGTLVGLEGEKIILGTSSSGSQGKKKKKEVESEKIAIPLSLISKANLEPNFEDERE